MAVISSALGSVIWQRLLSGDSLDGLGIPTIEGRTDLRGLEAPDPSVVRTSSSPVGEVKALSNLIVIKGVTLRGLDFSSARLKSLRFIDSFIEGCSFDTSYCQDWRLWGTTVRQTSFRGADLRGAALGGVDAGKKNAFQRVDFSKADLRRTAYSSADFVECVFSDTTLTKVDFQGSVFVDCKFEGVLEEVAFCRRAFDGPNLPPNSMTRVDFSGAHLRSVEFRGLDMESVVWPTDDDHLLVRPYKPTLDRILGALGARNDTPARKLAAYLAVYRKWAGPNQEVGVLSKRELAEIGGEALLGEIRLQLRPS